MLTNAHCLESTLREKKGYSPIYVRTRIHANAHLSSRKKILSSYFLNYLMRRPFFFCILFEPQFFGCSSLFLLLYYILHLHGVAISSPLPRCVNHTQMALVTALESISAGEGAGARGCTV